MNRLRTALLLLVAGVAPLAFGGGALAGDPDPEAVKRGKYIYAAAGCHGCHTDVKKKGAELAGGRALETPFGTFHGPNITPHPTSGIGKWSLADFTRALRHGEAPDGRTYFPVFPYTSFTKMTDADIADLWAYLRTIPASDRANTPHDTGLLAQRWTLGMWQSMNFEPGAFAPDPAKSEELNRGRYLVEALAHCGECHTPRGLTGGLDASMYLAGTADGPEGDLVPNITPHPETGIGKWSDGDLVFMLRAGLLPDGDVAGASMAEVVEQGTSKLTDADLKAIAAYLKTIPAIDNKPKK